jgi:hypothetical protein
MPTKQLQIISVEFGVTDKLLIRYSAFAQHLRKNVDAIEPHISHL